MPPIDIGELTLDAVVDSVHRNADGTVTLRLSPVDTPSLVGILRLHVVNPKPHLDAITGTRLRGNDSIILVAGRVFATRISATRIRLVDPPGRPAHPAHPRGT